MLATLRAAFRKLANRPALGMLRDDLRPGVRLFVPAKPANNYLIFYYAIDGGIEASMVIHAARDWQSLFAEGQRET